MKNTRFVIALLLGLFASSSFASPLAGKVFRKIHSFRFSEDGKKVSELVNGNIVRTCTYLVDDSDDFDGEGVILKLKCDGKEHQYILNVEHDLLSTLSGQIQFSLVQ